MSPERPPRRDPLRRRHPFEYPTILGLLAVAGLLAVVNGVFFPGPWAEKPKRPIDPKTAGQYIGKTVLIGVSKLGEDDQPLQRSEWVGRIARLSAPPLFSWVNEKEACTTTCSSTGAQFPARPWR